MTDRDYLTFVLEDMNRKFDLVLDSVSALDHKIERYREENLAQHEELKAAIRFTNVDLREKIGKVEDRLTGVEDRLTGVEDRLTGVENRFTRVESRLDGMEVKLDAVADDLAAHRADTESHTLYRVKEEFIEL